MHNFIERTGSNCRRRFEIEVFLNVIFLGKHIEAQHLFIPLIISSQITPKLDWDELKIKTTLGEGIMGTVYKGYWRQNKVLFYRVTAFIEFQVAIKMLKTQEPDEMALRFVFASLFLFRTQ